MSTYSVTFLFGENFEDYKFHAIITGTIVVNNQNIAVATIIDSPTAEHNFPVLNGSENDALINSINFLQKIYPGCKYVQTKIG